MDESVYNAVIAKALLPERDLYVFISNSLRLTYYHNRNGTIDIGDRAYSFIDILDNVEKNNLMANVNIMRCMRLLHSHVLDVDSLLFFTTKLTLTTLQSFVNDQTTQYQNMLNLFRNE